MSLLKNQLNYLYRTAKFDSNQTLLQAIWDGGGGGGYLEAVHLARNNKANIWPQYQKLAHSMVIKQQKPVEKQCQVQFDMW